MGERATKRESVASPHWLSQTLGSDGAISRPVVFRVQVEFDARGMDNTVEHVLPFGLFEVKVEATQPIVEGEIGAGLNKEGVGSVFVVVRADGHSARLVVRGRIVSICSIGVVAVQGLMSVLRIGVMTILAVGEVVAVAMTVNRSQTVGGFGAGQHHFHIGNCEQGQVTG